MPEWLNAAEVNSMESHFLFFTDKLPKDYNNELYDTIQRMCCEKWPQFADIIDKQVEPVYDAERRMVNTQDYGSTHHRVFWIGC